MKLSIIAVFIAAAVALPNFEGTSQVESFSLEKRDCSYEKGCRSRKDVTGGKYCGYCWEVTGTKNPTHVYQLNGESGKSGCCDYGLRKSCKAFVDNESNKVECGF